MLLQNYPRSQLKNYRAGTSIHICLTPKPFVLSLNHAISRKFTYKPEHFLYGWTIQLPVNMVRKSFCTVWLLMMVPCVCSGPVQNTPTVSPTLINIVTGRAMWNWLCFTLWLGVSLVLRYIRQAIGSSIRSIVELIESWMEEKIYSRNFPLLQISKQRVKSSSSTGNLASLG